MVVIIGDDVTVECVPSDTSYSVEWEYFYDTGSISIPSMQGGR